MVGLLRSAEIAHIHQDTQEVRGVIETRYGFPEGAIFFLRCQSQAGPMRRDLLISRLAVDLGMWRKPQQRGRGRSLLHIQFPNESSRMWEFLPQSLISGVPGLCLGDPVMILEVLVKEGCWGTSLVVQRSRICLPMQGTWVQSLVGEDPTCRAATEPVCTTVAPVLRALGPQLLRPSTAATEDFMP